MSIELDHPKSLDRDYESYRALSTSAVAGLIVGLLSCLAVLDWALVALPVIGVVLSVYAWRKIRAHSDELSGLRLAQTGLVLSCIFAAAGPAWLTYDYATEVPPGYERISYTELQP